MKIIKHEEPKLKRPTFLVDGGLSNQLEQQPMLRLMNKHFTCAVMGRAGTGKTSLVTGLLGTKRYMRKVWDTIIVFIPPNSRQSMKDSIFNGLPKDQIFDELNRQNLEQAYAKAEENARHHPPKQTLLVFDDVQQYMKNKDVESFMLHMINNRRHARLSFFLLCQSYQKMPRQIRLALTDVFCFRLSKSNMDDIFNELVEIPEKDWMQILSYYKHVAKSPDKHSFLYVHVTNQRFFVDWNELIVDDEWSDDEDADV